MRRQILISVSTLFHTRALSLQLKRRLSDDWAELAGASTPIFLTVGNGPEQRLEFWTVHLDFLTDNLEAAASKAREAGAKLVREFQERVWGRMANIDMAPGGYDRIDYVYHRE
jgi:hypothetical protein